MPKLKFLVQLANKRKVSSVLVQESWGILVIRIEPLIFKIESEGSKLPNTNKFRVHQCGKQ